MRLIALAAVSLFAVGACSEEPAPVEAPPAAPAPPPVLAGVDLTRPVRALGTEPFWGVDLTGAELVYGGADRAEQRAPQPKPVIQGTVATFEATTSAGQPITVTLAATECSDGMSDRTYPLTAMVKIGAETLNGCAASTAAIMTTGESGPVVEKAQPAG